MIQSIVDIVIKEVEQTNEEIRQTIISKRIDNTGAARESLRINVTGNEIQVLGLSYLEYLNRGRPPGKFPPIAEIIRWVNTKNIKIAPYVVARKIAMEGTAIYNNRALGIELEEKLERLNERLKQSLPDALRSAIKTKIRLK